MSILIDTNILARLVQKRHAQHATAVRAVNLLRRNKERLCIVPQNFFELWVICTRPAASANGLGLTTSQTKAQINRARGIFQLLADRPSLYEEWERLVIRNDVKGKNAHDARLVAAMNVHGIDKILTFNKQDFIRFTHIQVLSPEQVLAG